MPYIVSNSDSTIQITVPDQKVDTTNYSLALVGRQVSNYGQYFAQNTIRQLESFASATAPNPAVKLVGQLWFDKTTSGLRVWDGVGWKRLQIEVGNKDQKPTTDLRPGTGYFNTTNNKLEIYNGSEFKPAGYAGEVTSAFSASVSDNTPSHYGTILRTLYLEDTTGAHRPVLALSYVKTTPDTSSPANRGITQIGDNYETIMALFSDEEFDIQTTGAGTNSLVDGNPGINFAPELTQSGVGVASARSGRVAGRILKGMNQRAEYEATGVTTVTTLFANTIGSASNPVSSIFVTDLSVDSELQLESADVTNDLNIGGDLTVPAGDITAASGTLTVANIVVSAGSILNGDTTINGNITVNGVNTQSIGTDSEKIENFYGSNIDTQTLTVDVQANVATANVSTLNVSGDARVDGTFTTGNATFADVTLSDLIVNDTATFNSTIGVSDVATFNSDVNLGIGTTLTVGSLGNPGTIVGAVTNIDVNNSTASENMYVPFHSGATGSKALLSNNNLRFNPNTGLITAVGITGFATTIKTAQNSDNASQFLTFVADNNATATAENLLTDAGITYNPSTNQLDLTGSIGSVVNITASGAISASGTITFGSLSDGSITATAFESTLTGGASLLATSAAIKTYVDNANTAMQAYVDNENNIQDLDFRGDSGGALSIDLDSEVLDIAGGTNITTAGSGNQITVNLDNAVSITTLNATTSIDTATANVTGTATVGGVTDGTATMSGGSLSGVTNITGTGLLTMGQGQINGQLNVDGDTILEGNVDLGNATGDQISFVGRVVSHIEPDSTANNRNLGASGRKWNTVYADEFNGTATLVEASANNSTNESAYITFVDGASGSQGIETDSGLRYNPSSNTLSTSIFSGVATSAQYADLAEIYSADAEYEAGTVVKLGGSEEITQTTNHADTDVFGIISTNPAYLMNSEAEGLPVALTGRVPVKVIGKIKKGERLVSSDVPGHAWALGSDEYDARAIIGRALQDKEDGDVGVIEVVVGVK